MIILSIIFAGALVWISAVVQHVNNLTSVGSEWVMSDRSKPIGEDGLTGRLGRALRNNMDSALMWVPIAAVALHLGLASNVLTCAAVVYMVVRTSFTLGYWLKINMLRSLSWLIGMICIGVLAVEVVSAVLARA